MGRNDSEISILNGILKQVQDDIISPEEGIKLARDLAEEKQDYN